MILVDTSIWIDHLRQGESRLGALLESGAVLSHPAVIGELALGSIKERSNVLRLLADLPGCIVATHAETLGFIEARKLAGSGVGYVDASLLASAAVTPDARLWTRDARLAALATRLGLALVA